MRVLLTGTTGYIGRRLLDALVHEPDVRLRLLVRNAAKLNLPGKPWALIRDVNTRLSTATRVYFLRIVSRASRTSAFPGFSLRDVS